MGDFKDLRVWQKGHAFACDAYRACMLLPASEQFGLSQQLRRAAISIPANAAEGNGRLSKRDQARFFQIAVGSSREVEALLLLARDLNLLPAEVVTPLLTQLADVQRSLSALIAYCTRPSEG